MHNTAWRQEGHIYLFIAFCWLLLLLGRVVAVYRAKSAYSHRTFPPTICCLSFQCIVAKRLIGYGCRLGW